jgi:hypothetical protein
MEEITKDKITTKDKIITIIIAISAIGTVLAFFYLCDVSVTIYL